jgi:hypothetical protein
MRTGTRVCLIGLLAVFSGVDAAYAQIDQRVSFTVKIALDPSIGGSVTSAGPATVSGAPAVFTETKWTESHSKSSPLFVADVGYNVAPLIEVLGGFEYGRAGANAVKVGTVPSGDLTSSFSTYQFWGLEGGVRVGLHEGHGVYGLVTGGFRRVSELSAIFTAPGITSNRGFYDASAVPALGFGGGILLPAGGVGVGFEVCVKYAGSLTPAASPELAAVNNTGARWSLPISLVLRF